jgi:hypothetical protein
LPSALAFRQAADRNRLLAARDLLPERPLFSVPALRFFMTRSTSVDAFFEYLRAIAFLRLSFAW